jgi:putative methyltransferase (TIGR04325 family)
VRNDLDFITRGTQLAYVCLKQKLRYSAGDNVRLREGVRLSRLPLQEPTIKPYVLHRTVVRRVAAMIVKVERRPKLAPILLPLRTTVFGRWLARELLGYHRFYKTVAEADAYASKYLDRSHTDPLNIDRQLAVSEGPRVSDYPVLFHLRPLLANASVLFDVGGNVGNLFYCYRCYCELPQGFRWRVLDLPETIATGQRLAIERGFADTLEFANTLQEASGADILLVSGAAHYFDQSLAEMLATLADPPAHVFLNRSPLIKGSTCVTVQDAGFVMHGCKLFNIEELTADMRKLGYRVVDQWEAPELSLHVPLYPECSASAYRGFYFSRHP